jgi:hypothetical protein
MCRACSFELLRGHAVENARRELTPLRGMTPTRTVE